MHRNTDAWTLAERLMKRSACRVQMAAVVSDRDGRVFAWGWNHAGADGYGMCAERHALSRANPKRLKGATIHIRGFNRANESSSKPCTTCHAALLHAGIETVHYRDDAKRRRRAATRSLTSETLKRAA